MDLKTGHKALVVDRSAGSCGDRHCLCLRSAVERSNLFADIAEGIGATATAPNIIILRTSGEGDSQELIDQCRMRWNAARIDCVPKCFTWHRQFALVARIGG
jgi:hypothetical protein